MKRKKQRNSKKMVGRVRKINKKARRKRERERERERGRYGYRCNTGMSKRKREM